MPSNILNDGDCTSTTTLMTPMTTRIRAASRNEPMRSQAPRMSVRRVGPAVTVAYRHVERHVERVGVTHLSSHELFDGRTLTRRDFEHELVVDLQEQPRGQAGVLEPTLHAEHCHLDDVGR